MKTLYWIAMGATLTCLSACIPSVNPFYTTQDLCFTPDLVGRWQAKVNSGEPQTWEFEAADRAYKLTITDPDGKRGKFSAHLFKLKAERFLDIIPAECDFAPNQAELVGWAMFPGHFLLRVPQIGPELKLAFCDYDWLQKHLEQNPRALAHHTADKRVLLTATTRDLRRFILKHCREGELFQEACEFVLDSKEIWAKDNE